MRQNRQMLYNENNYTEENYIDWLREFKSEENVDWEEGNTADFMDWCNTMQENDFDDLVSNLSHSDANTYKVIVVGSVGTWRGTFDIEPCVCDNLVSAIYKCINNCEVRSIERVGNTIEISTYHHDGSNFFTIHILSTKGEEKYNKHGVVSINNKENVYKIPKYIY